LGTSDAITDLAESVDPDRDHVRGPDEAPVTVVEYGDFECPYCGRAEPAVRELLKEFGDVRYVWRHLPLTDVHPRAQAAAEAAEAAAEQGAFWEMHDRLLDHQDELKPSDLIRHAEELGLDVERFESDLERRAGAELGAGTVGPVGAAAGCTAAVAAGTGGGMIGGAACDRTTTCACADACRLGNGVAFVRPRGPRSVVPR